MTTQLLRNSVCLNETMIGFIDFDSSSGSGDESDQGLGVDTAYAISRGGGLATPSPAARESEYQALKKKYRQTRASYPSPERMGRRKGCEDGFASCIHRTWHIRSWDERRYILPYLVQDKTI